VVGEALAASVGCKSMRLRELRTILLPSARFVHMRIDIHPALL
jgi:hypothetical protein